MGYITYHPTRLADEPLFIAGNATRDGHLTITRILDADQEMRDYWQMGDEGWLFIEHADEDGSQSLFMPAYILSALYEIGMIYQKYNQPLFHLEHQDIHLWHRDISYIFQLWPHFAIYPSYHPDDGLDKRPYINDTDMPFALILKAIDKLHERGIEF